MEVFNKFETESLEYKKSTGELKEGIISLSSMLNKNGYGVLYFGVKDDGTVIGQQIGNSTLRDISRDIAYYIKPQIIPTITLELIDDKNVIKVEVSGYDKPYSAYGKCYMRSADEDREISPDLLKDMMIAKQYSDIITIIDSPRQDLTFKKLKNFYYSNNLSIDDLTFETNLELKNKNGKYNYMAYLLADTNDISIKVVKFLGSDKTEMIARNEYGNQCLISSMEQVLQYVSSLNETNVKLGSSKRKEDTLFDLNSFKEAWLNACCHTRWDLANPPAVYIFNDRIEVISTGGLPRGLAKEEFYIGISKPVNIKLQKIFAQLGFVEQTGHGVPLIIRNYGKNAFQFLDNFLNVIIRFNHNVDNEEVSLTNSESAILEILKVNQMSTINDISEITGFSESYIRKCLASLKERKIIERIGGRKFGYWNIIK